MAVKELLHRLQPVQIYVVLALSIVYFSVQLFLSHVTHALTLLICAYHMLCNIVALTGCIITIKHCDNYDSGRKSALLNDKLASQLTISKPFDDHKFVEIGNDAPATNNRERSLRNTFGWTRIDILTMLIVGIFLAAFCFSILVEAVQMLIHIDHQDTMHLPVAVFALSVVGLTLNGFCYALIGGYTRHQQNFLHLRATGDVAFDRDEMCRGSRRLSFKSKHAADSHGPNSSVATMYSNQSVQADAAAAPTTIATIASSNQKPSDSNAASPVGAQQPRIMRDILRDISSTIFVIICSIIIYFAENENVTKFIDPIMAIISCVALLVLSYPFMKESCLILLQTIPASIDIELFKSDLLNTFDKIDSVHDLHIWQMTSSKYVSTVHILFHSPNVYVEIKDSLIQFFHAQGIAIVTIQPEFAKNTADGTESKTSSNRMLTECLIGCQSDECLSKTCCSTNDLHSIAVDSGDCGRKPATAEASEKSTSMVSLNASTLSKHRQLADVTMHGVMRKSVSESHVADVSGKYAAAAGIVSSTVLGSSIASIAEDDHQADESIADTNDSDDGRKGMLSTTPPNARHIEASSLLDGHKTDADKQFTAELRAEIEEQMKRA